MASYILSNAADLDVTEIYNYSFLNFGESKAIAYLQSLEEALQYLATTPMVGKKIDDIRKGYRRYEHASHSIFYKIIKSDIFIVRILHQSMETSKHI